MTSTRRSCWEWSRVLSTRARPASKRRLGAIAALIAWLGCAARRLSPSPSAPPGGVLRARAPAFGVHRRRDPGSAARWPLAATRLSRSQCSTQPRGAVVAQARQSFNLSFDLWEERFAVTRVGTPPRSVSHLRSREAEAWCLEHLTVPRADLGRLGARDRRSGSGSSTRCRLSHPCQTRRNDDTFTLRQIDRRVQPPAARMSRSRKIGGRWPIPAGELAHGPLDDSEEDWREPIATCRASATDSSLTSSWRRSCPWRQRCGSLRRSSTAASAMPPLPIWIALSRTLEGTVRQFYQRERETLRQDALAGRVAPTRFSGAGASHLAGARAGVLGQR